MVYALPENFDVGFAGEVIQKFSVINARTLARLSELQVDMATLGVQTTLEQTRLFSDFENYRDLYSLESDLAMKYCDRVAKMSRQTTDVLIHSSDDIRVLLEDMLKTFPVENVTRSAATAKIKAKAVASTSSKPRADKKKKTTGRKTAKS